jgi:thioester reductase-like protein
VEQIYIHGDLLADSVAAVVVPNREYAQAFALEHNLKNFDMNNVDPQFYDAVLRDLRLIAEKESLRKHEIPSRLIIDFEPFTPENGLLTSTMKPCRHKLAAHYGDRLKPSKTIEQQLRTIIETVTGQSLLTDDENNVFIPTGGDSLTAVCLSRTIENDLGISVSLSILLKPNMTLQQLATVVKDPLQISSMSYSIVSQLLNDSQLNLDITVGERKNIGATPSMIFITGTTGFVGAFLLAELLSVYPSECKLVCLVRCESMMNPLDRIRQNMLFHQIWREDFQERIIPLQGDLGKTRFGLDIETYESLANQIDIIFHCGAIVNFVLPYSTLYDSNVCGTREIIRLATYTSTCIPIHYISTVSVLSSNVNNEVSIDEISPDGFVNGYAQSKWVAEKLMARASRLGLPVVIYRLGSICASTKTGACNRNDLYTLLFTAMMKINYYPETLANARLYGLPVDFTAESIVYLSRVQPDIYGKIYHVLNPNNQVLFTDIIDSMCCCGVQLKCVSLEEWRIKLKVICDRDSPFEFIEEFFHENSFNERCQISAEHFYTSISALNLPSLNDIYLMKWLTFILENIAR